MATKYKLSLQECMTLTMTTIPQVGKLGEARTHRDLREELQLSDDENELIGFREITDRLDRGIGRFRWDAEMGRRHFKLVRINQPGLDAIVKALHKVEESGEVTDDHIGLWDIFVALHKSMKDRIISEDDEDAPQPEGVEETTDEVG